VETGYSAALKTLVHDEQSFYAFELCFNLFRFVLHPASTELQYRLLGELLLMQLYSGSVARALPTAGPRSLFTAVCSREESHQTWSGNATMQL